MTLSLSARADHWGDRTAVVDVSAARRSSPERYSYADLASLATGFETTLADRGVGPGDVMAVLSRNRVRTLALLFACRRLGATVAPVSHRHTPATVTGPIDRLEPTLVVAEEAQGDLLAALEGESTATFDDLADDADADGSGRSPSDGRPERGETPLLALPVVSEPSEGSGLEAVVNFPADAVEATCRSVATTWGIGRADRLALTLPLSAPDGLLRVALPTLYSGGTLLLDRAFDPADLVAVGGDEPVTVLAGRTAGLRGLLDEGFPDAAPGCEIIADAGVPAALRAEYREHGLAVRRAYGTPVCPTILSGPAPDRGDGDDEGLRPPFDCRVRLVAEGGVVEGAGEGTLELAGPMVGERRETADAGRTDGEGWHPTGDRFRRDAGRRYHPC
ncbi:class I adenylate-forming enzyme family protein [Saliphagus sp. LR7]|uniref:AMP-binding protein n=1 Tax=Saliphagus sp. LR7 TaxID=2282654 RepID=UPI000DF7354D|nr:class I adenylate-forming enzyme family protein [Saliphagus sp. LR7]